MSVCGRSPVGIAGSNPAEGHGFLSVESVLCSQVEVSATSRSLAQLSLTECGMSEYDRETSVISRPKYEWGCRAMTNKN